MGRKLTHHEFLERIKSIKNIKEFEFLEEYSGYNQRIKIKHYKCGKEFNRGVEKIILNQSLNCPYCNPMSISFKRNVEEYQNLINEIHNNEYTVLGEYINTDSYIKIKHNVCNNIYDVKATCLTRKNPNRCPYCFGNNLKTHKEFLNLIKQRFNDLEEYEFLEEYKQYDTKILVKHKLCGTEYFVSPNKFLSGRRCPFCRISQGEKKIADYLKFHNIYFEREKTFPDLRDKYPLRFDFYIYYKEKYILIEYDGRHHFESFSRSKNISDSEKLVALRDVQKKDEIKNEYALKNDLRLIRIKYTEFDNIETILNAIFN